MQLAYHERKAIWAPLLKGFPGGVVAKNLPANLGDAG